MGLGFHLLRREKRRLRSFPSLAGPGAGPEFGEVRGVRDPSGGPTLAWEIVVFE